QRRSCRATRRKGNERAAVRLRSMIDVDEGADLHALIEVDDVLIGHAEAARRDSFADRLRFVRTVDAIQCRAEIDRPRAERVVRSALHIAWQIRLTLQHLLGRPPIRPFALLRNFVRAGPAESVAADADAVADRAGLALHVIEPALLGVYDDGA